MENCKNCNKKIGAMALSAPYCDECLENLCNVLSLEGFKKGRIANYQNNKHEPLLKGYEILNEEAEELVRLAE